MPNMADRWVSDFVCHVWYGFDYNQNMEIAGWIVFGIVILFGLYGSARVAQRESHQLKQSLGFSSMKIVSQMRWYVVDEENRKSFYKYKMCSFMAKGLMVGVIVFLFLPSISKLWLLPYVCLLYWIGIILVKRRVRDDVQFFKNWENAENELKENLERMWRENPELLTAHLTQSELKEINYFADQISKHDE